MFQQPVLLVVFFPKFSLKSHKDGMICLRELLHLLPVRVQNSMNFLLTHKHKNKTNKKTSYLFNRPSWKILHQSKPHQLPKLMSLILPHKVNVFTWNRFSSGADMTQSRLFCFLKNTTNRTSLVVQWIKIYLPMQGTQVRFLVGDDSTCCRATKPVGHDCWVHALQQAKPLQWEACAPQQRVALCSLQLEKAWV